MILNVTVKATILKKMAKEFEDSKGVKQPYYQLVIDQNDNVETFGCTLEVYENIKQGGEYELNATLNTGADKVRLRFTSFATLVTHPVSGTSAPAGASGKKQG